MSPTLLTPKSVAARKHAAFKPFFGLDGDVEDPFLGPDRRDQEATVRIRDVRRSRANSWTQTSTGF